jgi:hypothetical protein
MRGSAFIVTTLVSFTSFAATASVAAAQTPRAIVHVTAHDSTGAVIPAAELTITRGLKDVVAHGTTDESGDAYLSVETKDSSDVQVTMRKIGYARGDRFFSIAPHDTARVTVTVARTHNTLDAVKVTAKAKDQRWTSYHLVADEIEASNEPMDNAWDVIKALRPVMLTSRGGCGTGVREVWVNGKRIRLPLPPTGLVRARERVGAPIDARFSQAAVSILSDIAPEHIQELNYHDCFDASMAAVGNNNAVFVTLKPGVVYKENVGSFVAEETPASRATR